MGAWIVAERQDGLEFLLTWRPHSGRYAAYQTHAREAVLKARGVKPRLARRPNKNHPELPPRLKRCNNLIASRHAAVETTFATWKMVAIAFNMRRWAALNRA